MISGSLKSDNSGAMFIDHGTVGQDIRFRTGVSSALDTDSVKITAAGNIKRMLIWNQSTIDTVFPIKALLRIKL